MKKYLVLPILFSLLFLSACTQESVAKNTALRYVVVQFDEELKANPDAEQVAEIRKHSEISIEDVKMANDKEALVQIQIKTVKGKGDLTPIVRQIPVKVVKNGTWSVEEATKAP